MLKARIIVCSFPGSSAVVQWIDLFFQTFYIPSNCVDTVTQHTTFVLLIVWLYQHKRDTDTNEDTLCYVRRNIGKEEEINSTSRHERPENYIHLKNARRESFRTTTEQSYKYDWVYINSYLLLYLCVILHIQWWLYLNIAVEVYKAHLRITL